MAEWLAEWGLPTALLSLLVGFIALQIVAPSDAAGCGVGALFHVEPDWTSK